MAVMRYIQRNPWRELDQLTHRLSRMLDAEVPGFPVPSSGGNWLPAVSVEETHEELILTAELPGMRPEDVDVQLENNILTLRGEKREERQEADDNRRYHLWERSYGNFERAFTLPRTVRPEHISAEFDNGLLRIRMPKAPEAKSRRIEISTGNAQGSVGSGEAAQEK